MPDLGALRLGPICQVLVEGLYTSTEERKLCPEKPPTTRTFPSTTAAPASPLPIPMGAILSQFMGDFKVSNFSQDFNRTWLRGLPLPPNTKMVEPIDTEVAKALGSVIDKPLFTED